MFADVFFAFFESPSINRWSAPTQDSRIEMLHDRVELMRPFTLRCAGLKKNPVIISYHNFYLPIVNNLNLP